MGIFPMARAADDPNVEWIDPPERGVIPIDRPQIPARLARTVRTTSLRVLADTNFREVMLACAEPAAGRPSTWINEPILDGYCKLFETGHAHSIEVWDGETLVGGLYGVHLGSAFFGESMFSRVRDASKIALVHLIARLRRGGFQLLDAQFVTKHLRQFGAHEVERETYLKQLEAAISRTANFYELGPAGAAVSGLAVLQDTTQTS